MLGLILNNALCLEIDIHDMQYEQVPSVGFQDNYSTYVSRMKKFKKVKSNITDEVFMHLS